MAVIMGLMCVFCMMIIFSFSYQNAEVSSDESMSLYKSFVGFFGDREIISHNAFRKLAHFSEYAALSFSFTGTMYSIKRKLCPWINLFFCVLYSMSDEVHQFFVPERACRPFDVFVDSLGIFFGMGMFFITACIVQKIVYKKRHSTDSVVPF